MISTLFDFLMRMLVVLAVIMASGSSALAGEVFHWRLGSPVSPGDPFEEVLAKYAKEVEERTAGRMDIEVVAIKPLGFKPADSLRILRQGVLEAMFIFPQYAARDEPLLAALMPQGGLLNMNDNLKIIEIQTKIAQEILSGWGMTAITRLTDTRSASFVIASKRPINSLEEMQRVKLRHFTKLGINAFNQLGVATQYIPSSDLFLAIKMGIVDATVYSPSYIRSQSIYEATCCFSEMGYYTLATPSVVAANNNVWMKLPADLRTIMREVGQEMFDKDIKIAMSRANEAPIISFLKEKGMRVLPPFSRADRMQIQEALFAVWEDQCNQLGPKATSFRKRILQELEVEGTDIKPN